MAQAALFRSGTWADRRWLWRTLAAAFALALLSLNAVATGPLAHAVGGNRIPSDVSHRFILSQDLRQPHLSDATNVQRSGLTGGWGWVHTQFHAGGESPSVMALQGPGVGAPTDGTATLVRQYSSSRGGPGISAYQWQPGPGETYYIYFITTAPSSGSVDDTTSWNMAIVTTNPALQVDSRPPTFSSTPTVSDQGALGVLLPSVDPGVSQPTWYWTLNTSGAVNYTAAVATTQLIAVNSQPYAAVVLGLYGVNDPVPSDLGPTFTVLGGDYDLPMTRWQRMATNALLPGDPLNFMAHGGQVDDSGYRTGAVAFSRIDLRESLRRSLRLTSSLDRGSVYLEVANGSTANGAVAQVAPEQGVPNQNWQFVETGSSDSVNVVNANSDKCLDSLDGPNSGPGSWLDQWDCEGQDTQKFAIQPANDGYNDATITSTAGPTAGLCVGVQGSSTAPATPLDFEPCDGQPNQAFDVSFNPIPLGGGQLPSAVSVPSSLFSIGLSPGSNYGTNVTVTNTGNQTWTHGALHQPGTVALGVHLQAHPGGPFGFITDDHYNLTPDVPPGGSYTFQVNIAPPADLSPGWYFPEFEMVDEGVAWSDDWVDGLSHIY